MTNGVADYRDAWITLLGDTILKEKDLENFLASMVKEYNMERATIGKVKGLKIKDTGPGKKEREEIKKLKEKLTRAKKTNIKLRKEGKTLEKRVKELEAENEELREYYDRFDILDL